MDELSLKITQLCNRGLQLTRELPCSPTASAPPGHRGSGPAASASLSQSSTARLIAEIFDDIARAHALLMQRAEVACMDRANAMTGDGEDDIVAAHPAHLA